ncbi:hypothetical protein ILYODFUR_014394 [Ilyodon furcidens]|uniref:HAT C-terminal dimerisation domain-containing protein n=1 Tax=Ilyodon furcidens TaxID=33524 RepID=A0ABV0SPK2_9TELE
MQPQQRVVYFSTSAEERLLGLTLASAVVGELECLNISLQKKTLTVSGMQAAVNHVRSSLKGKRNDKSYLALYEKATTLVDSTESIDPIQVTHSSRFVGKAEDHYRAEFFKVLDSVEVQFCQRFDQVSLKILQKVENALLTGEVDESLDQYPELNRASLYSCLSFATNTCASAVWRQQRFSGGCQWRCGACSQQVEVLIRILMVVPVSSCEAERSFSSLRR